ncbi:calcium-binding protein [Streptomyces bungoensis]|uniref:calcium-binding protein n=1 Tax=Streptomyces bungoensis TaxID=285568 RepID=UPI00343F58FA
MRFATTAAAVAALAALLIPSTARAAPAATAPGKAAAVPGDLDPAFGTGGKVTTDFGGDDAAEGVALQVDGKTVTAGYSSAGGDFVLARYNTDGSLDASFGSGGKVTTDFSGGYGEALAVTVQADDKIVAAGWIVGSAASGPEDFALARYNPDGSLDASFGSGGELITDFGGTDAAQGVTVQPDGKIVAVGFSTASGPDDFALARYNPDGSLDTSFGTGGKVTTDFGVTDEIEGVALQADGKIVAAGWSGGPGGYDFALARYGTDGSLDASFGTGGKVTTDFGGTYDQAFGVALQNDGKIVAAGLSGGDFALARYDSGGSLDASFGTGGTVTTDFGADDQAEGVSVQTDGKIVAAGWSAASGSADFALARYDTDGTLDASFGTGGKVTTDFGGSDAAEGVALQTDGKIVAAGHSSGNFALARYLSVGKPQQPSLSITKNHTRDFVQGKRGTYTITISNQGTGPTDGSTVTVHDTLPQGLLPTHIHGPRWNCDLSTLTCTRNDFLAAGSSYPPITLIVDVPCTAPLQGIDTATVTGGGDNTIHTTTDPTTIKPDKNCAKKQQHH